MKKTLAYHCLCQDCDKFFQLNRYMTTVINIDEDVDECIQLLSVTLNCVKCPECGSAFSYEIPMLLFSNKHKFAIRVNPSLVAYEADSGDEPPVFLSQFQYKYREVTFQIEALEKVRIFMAGLDDKLIEYIKLKTFKDEDATPFEDVNIVFESADNHSFFFAKMDSNNNIIARYEVNRKEYDDICFDDCLNRWQCINRYTINRYIKKEN